MSRSRTLLMGLVLALLFTGFLRSPRATSADAPGKPAVTRVAALDPNTVRVTFENFASEAYGVTGCVAGCGYRLRFDLRYHSQSDTSGSQYTYIGPVDDFGNSPQLRVITDQCLFPVLGSPCQGGYVEPALDGLAHYDVTGLTPGTAYCFAVRAVAEEFDLVFDESTEYSDFSAERCTTTPASPPPASSPSSPSSTPTPQCATPPCLLGGPLPNIDLSFLGALAPYIARITSPTANQLFSGDVLVNVVRAQQDKDDGLFDLQWGFLQAGSWQTPDSGPLDQIDKSSFPNGVSLPNSAFKTFPCGSDAASCQFRNWRVRARLHGVAAAPFPSGAPWSDWVPFRVCSAPSGSC